MVLEFRYFVADVREIDVDYIVFNAICNLKKIMFTIEMAIE